MLSLIKIIMPQLDFTQVFKTGKQDKEAVTLNNTLSRQEAETNADLAHDSGEICQS